MLTKGRWWWGGVHVLGVVVAVPAWGLSRPTALVAVAQPPSAFAAIALHELAHVLAARQLGTTTWSIVARGPFIGIERAPLASPGREAMAIVAGPLVPLGVGVLIAGWSVAHGHGVALLLTPVWLVQGVALLPWQHDGRRLRSTMGRTQRLVTAEEASGIDSRSADTSSWPPSGGSA